MASPNLALLAMKEISKVVLRANGGASFDERELKREIEDLLSAVGTANDGSEDAFFFANPPVPDALHLDFVKEFHAIAASDGPIDPRIYSRMVIAKLNAAVRGKWTSRRYKWRVNRPDALLSVTSEFLTEAERDDVKQFANELEAYHQAQIKRQRPAKIDQDTLLDGLADIYLRHTGSSKHPYELPHSVRSHFILFCHAVLRPFFPLTETSTKALSNRWHKLRQQQFAPPKDLRFASPPDEA